MLTTKNGNQLAKYSVAYNRGKGDSRITDWHDIVAWGRQAEVAAEYFKKGDTVIIQGHLQVDQWEDKETGGNRRKTVLVADFQHFPPKGFVRIADETEEKAPLADNVDEDIPF